jgi:adenylate kinase
MIVIIFGPPGCGKGTQSKLIAEKYHLKHISTGDLLRSEVDAQTSIGLQVKKYLEQGVLVPDQLIIDMLISAMAQNAEQTTGIILDGFPRTVSQAEALTGELAANGLVVNVLIDLLVDKDELMKRMIQRGIDTGRTDDTPETILKRLEVYNEKTCPVVDFYKMKRLYKSIDGMGEINEVFTTVCEILDEI